MSANYLVMDIGGTNLQWAEMTAGSEITATNSQPTPQDYPSFIAAIKQITAKTTPKAVQIALPGIYNKTKDLIFAPNIPYLAGKNILSDLAADIPVIIENDANMAALGEYVRGFTNPPSSLVFLTLGTGFGGGVILGRHLLTGNTTFMELGHMTLIAEGRSCGCGKKGCVEKYCTASAIVADYIAGSGDVTASDTFYVARKAAEGDFAAFAAFEMFSLHLAHTITSLINIFNPEAVRIGGGLSSLADYFFPSMCAIVDDICLPAFKGKCDIAISPLKNDAAFYGGLKWITSFASSA